MSVFGFQFESSGLEPKAAPSRMSQKRNVVLYLDKELVEKSRELGFKLSKTFENTLKQLINTYSNVNSLNNNRNSDIQNTWWAGPDLNRRPLARKANVLTKLDDQPTLFWLIESDLRLFCFMVFCVSSILGARSSHSSGKVFSYVAPMYSFKSHINQE